MYKTVLIRFTYLSIMFLAGLILSNLALPQLFGTISLLVLNASLFSLVTGLGSDNIVIYKVSSGQWNISQAFQYTWRTLLIQIALLIVFELGNFFLFHQSFLSGKGPFFILIDTFYFFGLICTEKYLALFYCVNKARSANIILTVVGSVYFLSLLVLYYFAKIDVIYIILFFAFQSLLQAISLMFFFGVDRTKETIFENVEFFKTIKLSSILMITNIIQLLVYRVDFWFLKLFWGNYAVGLYAQANKFANLSWIVPNIITQLLLPRFISMSKSQVGQIFSVAFYFNFFLVVTTTVATQFFYSFVLKSDYGPALVVFYLMLPGYFFWATVIFYSGYISAAGKFIYNLIGSSLCFILILIADLLLIPKYGIKGAAIGNSLCYTAVFVYFIFILKEKFSFRLKSFFSLSRGSWTQVLNLVHLND